MIAGVVKESFQGERRVALVPAMLGPLSKAGAEVVIESGAGVEAGYADDAYTGKGARILPSRRDVIEAAEVLLQVRAYGSNLEAGRADLEMLGAGKTVVGMCDPLGEPAAAKEFAGTGATLFSMEMMPRITRAQSMDVLSSMATVAGYKAVLMAADHLPKMFPLMMTAAGTVSPARVFIIGAGVAGLQAISVARRLGAQVTAYDIRDAVKEQIESLGGKFLEIKLETGGAEDAGGYATSQSEEFYRRQQEMMTATIAESDVVITTAAVPGKKAPVLVTRAMVDAMSPGSVIVDLAAERGGNCEVTKPGETVEHGGVTVLGPANMPSMIPFHASQMYSKNITTFLQHLLEEGELKIDTEDEITRGTLIARGGRVEHPAVLEALGMET
jgi:NAD(P) transhydrogenase subunit alpha